MPTKAKEQQGQLNRGFEPYQPAKGEEYMSDAMRAHFTDILNKWKLELMQEVDRTVTHMQDEAANFPDPADRQRFMDVCVQVLEETGARWVKLSGQNDARLRTAIGAVEQLSP